MKTLILLNKKAGSIEKATPLEQEAKKYSADLKLIDCPTSDEAHKIISHAIEDEGFETIVAGGGDGTIHEVANAIEPYLDRVKLGIIPLGTGNDLCRTLGVPEDPVEALNLILSGKERRIDLIHTKASDKEAICVNLASGGIGGEIEKVVDKKMKERWGALSYVRGAATVATSLTQYNVDLQLDQNPIQRVQALNIIVANGRAAGGGYEVAPHADPQDRMLDIVIVHQTGALDLATIAARLFAGDYTKSEQVSFYRAHKISIKSDPEMYFSVDGSLFSKTPIEFSVLPRALRVAA